SSGQHLYLIDPVRGGCPHLDLHFIVVLPVDLPPDPPGGHGKDTEHAVRLGATGSQVGVAAGVCRRTEHITLRAPGGAWPVAPDRWLTVTHVPLHVRGFRVGVYAYAPGGSVGM